MFLTILIYSCLPSLVFLCGSDVTGSSSVTAEFNIDFFSPISYTYPQDESDIYPGQPLTLALANANVKRDMDLAIAKALTENQLSLSAPPTVNVSFTPQQISIVDGDKCTTDGTWIAISGTVIYKCGVSKDSGTTKSTSDSPVVGTTEATVETTTSGNNDDIWMHALPRRRATSGVTAQPFVQSMKVMATTLTPLYSSQWMQIGRSVQSALEDRKLLFNEEIAVVLL